jgi:dTDP-4-dehydrorhamnose 3,5-epimerase
MIDGVKVIPLKKIPDERGCIYHMLRNDDPLFEKFGEIYFSKIYPDVIKGWHIHTKMVLNYAVVSGMIKLVLYDDRKNSKTKGEIMEIFMEKKITVL